MESKLAKEIKMIRGFPSLEAEAYLNLQRTAWATLDEVSKMMRGQGVTPQQYNVLRILRGAGEDGLMCSEISNRMLTRDSDVTRLLDKLERHGYVQRERSTEDRRVVIAVITEKGRDLAEELLEPLHQKHVERFGKLGAEKLRTLIELLEEVRDEIEKD